MATWIYREVPRPSWQFQYGSHVAIVLMQRPEEDDPHGWAAELWLGGRSMEPMKTYGFSAPTTGSAQLLALKCAIQEFRAVTANLERMARMPSRKRSLVEAARFDIPDHVERVLLSDLRPLKRGYWVHDANESEPLPPWGVDGLDREEACARLHELGWVLNKSRRTWVRTPEALYAREQRNR
jgi:hypothetical protein